MSAEIQYSVYVINTGIPQHPYIALLNNVSWILTLSIQMMWPSCHEKNLAWGAVTWICHYQRFDWRLGVTEKTCHECTNFLEGLRLIWHLERAFTWSSSINECMNVASISHDWKSASSRNDADSMLSWLYYRKSNIMTTLIQLPWGNWIKGVKQSKWVSMCVRTHMYVDVCSYLVVSIQEKN